MGLTQGEKLHFNFDFRHQVIKFVFTKLKHKIIWEAFYITLHLLIQPSRFHTIQCRQITVEQNLPVSYEPNHRLNIDYFGQ